MEQDYKEQLRMMTEGLGEWMDRREREQRRWLRVALRVALSVVVVAAAVLLQVFFPWRRETVKYIYVKDSLQIHDTITTQPSKQTFTKKPTGIAIGEKGVRISGSENGEWGSIDIDENGVRIIGGGNEEVGGIVIDANGVRINGKEINH
ncbi:MAG: hypothetical protein K6F72_08050 [Bacteroidales bacterium]|nr:hypothetical protein [Bacteroidales bacterium]